MQLCLSVYFDRLTYYEREIYGFRFTCSMFKKARFDESVLMSLFQELSRELSSSLLISLSSCFEILIFEHLALILLSFAQFL